MHQATLRLAIELQLEELRGFMALRKRKQLHEDTTDADLAISMYKAELEVLSQANMDTILCRSIADAVCLDGDAIGEISRDEQQAFEDRLAAQHLERGGRLNHRWRRSHHFRGNSQVSALSHVDDELFERMLTLNDPSQSEVSSRGHRMATCVCCMDEYPSRAVARFTCDHEYCRECIIKLYTDVLTDESLFPLRCCKKPIPIEVTQGLLPPGLLGQFRAKEVEYNTLDRTYCHIPTCSTFIPEPFTRSGHGKCPRCERLTCLICKGAFHLGEDCPQDPATQEILALAKENGWVGCYNCHRLVELNLGCNHISEYF